MNKKLVLLPALLMLLTSCGGGGGGGKPTKHDGKSVETAFTAAEAIQAGKDLGIEVGQTSEEKYYVKDVVLSIKSAYSASYGNISLNLGTADATFIAFQVGKLVDGEVKKIAETDKEAELQAGDTVCVYGQITQYQADVWETPGKSAAGIASYTFGPEHVTPEPPEVHEVTVAQALAVIADLADGASTTDKYKVTGLVKGEVKTGKSGDYQFHMVDALTDETDLYIYYATPAEGLATPKEGDRVVVEGILKKYVKGETVTPEMDSGAKLLSVTPAN